MMFISKAPVHGCRDESSDPTYGDAAVMRSERVLKRSQRSMERLLTVLTSLRCRLY